MRSAGIFFFSIALIGLWLLLPDSQSYAGPDVNPALIINPDKQFAFAEHYFSSGDYIRAVGEYQRFIFFFPNNKRVELARFMTGMSYFKSNRFRDGIETFSAIIDQFGDTKLTIRSYLMISECHLELGESGAALLNLQNLLAVTEDDIDVRDEANYRIGWIYLNLSAIEKAREHFAKISAPNHHKYRLQKLELELEKEKLIPRKKPALAGFLSIIPGAGYLYCERYRDALIALLVNGSLFYAAYEAFDSDNDALGGIISFVGLGFYTGSIYGSVSSAHKYNHSKTRQFLEDLKQKTYINLSAAHDNRGFRVSFQFDF